MLARPAAGGPAPDRGGAGLRRASLPAWCAVGALALFAATACRTLTFGDAGELIAAAWRHALAHPPGYPVYSILAWLSLQIPIGEPALRTNLLSAACAALACGLVAAWAHGAWRSRAAGVAAAGILATSTGFWELATLTEVYALHAALMAAFLFAAWSLGSADDPTMRRRSLYLATCALGLGLAHHPTIVLAVPSALIWAWPARRSLGARDRLLGAALILAIPALFDATLLLRAHADPTAWGGVRDLETLWRHVAASRYRMYDVGWAGLTRGEAWSRIGGALFRGTAFTGALAAIAGLVRTRGRDRLALGLLAAAGIVFTARYATPDSEGHALPALIALAMLAGGAVAAAKRAAPALAAILVAVPLVANYTANDRSAARSATWSMEDMLATLPQDAILFVDGDDAFLLAYATQVLGRRPDVTLHDRAGNMATPYAGAGTMEGDLAVIGRSTRPVFFQSWPGYELPPRWRFEPEGLFWRVVPAETPPADDAALWRSYHERGIAREARDDGGHFALAIAAYYPVMRGEEALARGRVDEARSAFDEAVALAPRVEPILNTLGTTWGRHGDFARAATMFERAAEALPSSQRAWSNLAMARERMGDRQGAARARERAGALER